MLLTTAVALELVKTSAMAKIEGHRGRRTSGTRGGLTELHLAGRGGLVTGEVISSLGGDG